MFKVGDRVFWNEDGRTKYNRDSYKGTVIDINCSSLDYSIRFDFTVDVYNYRDSDLQLLGISNPNSGIILKE